MTTDRPMGIEVTQADRDALNAAWNEYACHMGDPDGKDDAEAALDAAAAIIARHRQSSIASLTEDVGDDEQPGDYIRDELMNIAAICKAREMHVEAASLRSTAAVVSEQFRKMSVDFGIQEGLSPSFRNLVAASLAVVQQADALDEIAIPAIQSLRDALTADSAASLTDAPDAVREALKPFASFAETFVGAEGWAGPMGTERIVDWFGPSDFRAALAALTTPAAKDDAGRSRGAVSGDAGEGE